jgi:hypothetical protein
MTESQLFPEALQRPVAERAAYLGHALPGRSLLGGPIRFSNQGGVR